MLLSYILWDIREELCLRGGECNDEEKQGSCIYNLIAERVFVRCSQRWLEMAPSLSTLTVHRTMAEQPTASSEMCWRRRMTALCSLRVWSLVATQAEKQREFMRAKGAYITKHRWGLPGCFLYCYWSVTVFCRWKRRRVDSHHKSIWEKQMNRFPIQTLLQ